MDRNEIINIMNHALQFVPKENEIADELDSAIKQLEKEWKDEFEDEDI